MKATTIGATAQNQLTTYAACVYEPGDIVEVRRLPTKVSTWHLANELAELRVELTELSSRRVCGYAGANPRRKRGGKNRAAVLLARCLFVDFDLCDLDTAIGRLQSADLPKPTMTVITGGGVHIYWRLSTPIEDLVEWTETQKALIAAVGSDRSVHDPARVMRLPGLANYKYDPPRDCYIVEAQPSRRYSTNDFGHVRSEVGAAASAATEVPSGPVPEGSRNGFLFKQASAMRSRGMSMAAITAALLAENQSRCEPPLEDAEVRQIAASTSRYPATTGNCIEFSWEPPIPLGQFSLPEFPLEAIPDRLAALREFCAEVSRSYQVPPDLPALLGISVGGAALARRFEVHGGDDWYEPLNVFVAVGLNSGERKSATFREMTGPVSDYERVLAEGLAPHIEERLTERAILSTALAAAIKKAARATKPEDQQEWNSRAKQLATELQRKPAIKAPQLIADDVTPEALAKLMYENSGRIAILSPEGDTFDLIAGRYSANGQPNLGVYLKGHAGDEIRVNRVSKDRPPEYVRAPALTIGLAIQPAVLQGLLERPGFRGKGLLARFLYSLPKSSVGYRELRPRPIADAVKLRYRQVISAALSITPDRSTGEERPHQLVLSDGALRYLDEFRGQVEIELRESGRLIGLRDWGSKAPGLVVRIAGIFHGLMHPDLSATRIIDAETMLCAVGVGEYAVAHALAAFFEMGADPAVGIARQILDWLREERRSEFSKREVYMELRGVIQRVAELDDPLQLLCTHGFVRSQSVERPGPGRKPSQLYRVNPIYRAQNAQNAQKTVRTSNSAYCAHSAPGAQE